MRGWSVASDVSRTTGPPYTVLILQLSQISLLSLHIEHEVELNSKVKAPLGFKNLVWVHTRHPHNTFQSREQPQITLLCELMNRLRMCQRQTEKDLVIIFLRFTHFPPVRLVNVTSSGASGHIARHLCSVMFWGPIILPQSHTAWAVRVIQLLLDAVYHRDMLHRIFSSVLYTAEGAGGICCIIRSASEG